MSARRRLVSAAVALAAVAASGLFTANSARSERMPPSCTDLREELGFTFALYVIRHAPEAADEVRGQVRIVIGPAQQGQDACAPTDFHIRLFMSYHHDGKWIHVAVGKADVANPVAGTEMDVRAQRICTDLWNGRRQWRLRMDWWGKTGLGAFQHPPAKIYPDQAGKTLHCLSG